MNIRRIKLPAARRRPGKVLLAAVLTSALCATLALAQNNTPRHVWVTFHYDGNGDIVAAESWGDCPIGGWGQPTGNSQTFVFDCDGALPY